MKKLAPRPPEEPTTKAERELLDRISVFRNTTAILARKSQQEAAKSLASKGHGVVTTFRDGEPATFMALEWRKLRGPLNIARIKNEARLRN